ncbi:MAG: BrnA antitoxin family protein [Gammaproteobacteria bacterium]|nr:BrnA antitoxin family protein [Gammaproteobacteria bacterium]
MNVKKKSISSDLKKLDNMKEADIDYSDIPPLDESFFQRKTVTLPRKKDSLTLRVDHDVLEFFKQQGKGYQTLINAVLRTYAHTKQHRQQKNQ